MTKRRRWVATGAPLDYDVRTVVRESNSRSVEAPASAVPRRRRRHDARRDGILRAAARMFRERGFAETGMRDIAGAADLSAANLYHYFGGKDEILYYCQDRALDQMLGAAGATRRGDHPYADRLREILAAHVRTLLDDVEGATAHLQTESLPPALRRRIVAKRDRYELAIRRLVSAGIDAGEFAGLDAAVITRAMLGAVNWTVTWFRPEGPSSSEAIADTIARFLVRGIEIDADRRDRRTRTRDHGR
jgi:AcrR family transcriptional regulator